jgi:hypothetical protein
MHTHTHYSSIGGMRGFLYQPFGLMPKWYDGTADGGAGGQGGGAGSGAGAGAGAGGGGGAGTGDGEAKLTLTETEFDARIQGRLEQARKKWEKEHGQSMTDEERAELETARKEREENKRRSLEEKGKYQEALKQQEESIRKSYDPELKTRDEKIDAISKRLRGEIVTNKLLAAASAGNAYNAEQAVRLTEPYVTLDDDFEPIVVDEKGKQRFVAANPMTPSQLMEEFLKANPHLVKAPAGANGGGAGGGAHLSGAGNLSEQQRLEAEVAELAKKYKETRSPDVQTLHRKKSAELKKLVTAA